MPALFTLFACSGDPRGPQPEYLCAADARCVSAPARDVIAVDGDTFELRRLTDQGEQRIRLRLIGWDSPETGEAANCPAEQDLGEAVENAAKEMFAAGKTVTFLPESVDQYGRTRAHVWLDEVHIGWALAGEGLSRKMEEGTRPDWCA